MLLLRSLFVYRKKTIMNHRAFQSLTIRAPSFMSTNKKIRLDQQLQMLADTIPPSSSQEDYSEVANNYIQLEEGSFSQYAKQNKNDPQMMLMLLSSFEDQAKIADFLPMLYPYIDYYEKSELLLFMQKVLAFKPKFKPKVPHPKPLQDIESILVIMGEIYRADQLIEWMKLVPVYTKKDFYVLYMGYFSILEKMSPQVKNRNQALWVKCHQKIAAILQDENEPLQVRVGILILAFQLSYGQAVPLLLLTNIDYQRLDPFKLCLLFINISKYLGKRSVASEGISEKDQQKIERMFKKCMNQIVAAINNTEMLQFMKADLMMDMWAAVLDLKQVRGSYVSLTNKLTSLVTNKKYLKTVSELATGELLVIFECLQKHKINNEKALKLMLVLFSTHLQKMSKSEFIRLLRCLVTYVRQCEDYLINVRQILEKRKAEFTNQEALQINDILRRVEVLFPRKFAVPR